MKAIIKQHGEDWFFKNYETGEDELECPECGNDKYIDFDLGPVTKIKTGYQVEFRCENCHCHGAFSKTNKELKEHVNEN